MWVYVLECFYSKGGWLEYGFHEKMQFLGEKRRLWQKLGIKSKRKNRK